MADLIAQLVALFSPNTQKILEKETFSEFRFKSASSSLSRPQASLLEEHFNLFPKRDNLIVSIGVIEDDEPILFSSHQISNIPANLASLENRLRVSEAGDLFHIDILIQKNISSEDLSVYREEFFLNYLTSLSLRDQLIEFDQILRTKSRINLRSQEAHHSFTTSSITFIGETASSHHEQVIQRDKLLSIRNGISNFSNSSQIQLTPDDFRLKSSLSSETWKKAFAILEDILAIAFTVDYSAFDAAGDQLEFKLNGYKTITGSISKDQLNSLAYSTASEIYQWAYQGGSPSDKVSLFRNILSIHLDEQGTPRFDRQVFDSLRSGYAIYLKENVGQYIELKNRLSEFIADFARNSLEEVRNYGTAVKENFFAVATFYITVFIINSISEKGFQNIFTYEITMMSYLVAILSTGYLILSCCTLKDERNRIEENYKSIKERYSDLLDRQDIERIFNKDDLLSKTVLMMKKRASLITGCWIGLIATVVIFTIIVGSHSKPFKKAESGSFDKEGKVTLAIPRS